MLVAFGDRVRSLREQAGLSQEEVADGSGMHWSYVGQIERGQRNLGYLNILSLARGLGVEPSRLVQRL